MVDVLWFEHPDGVMCLRDDCDWTTSHTGQQGHAELVRHTETAHTAEETEQ